MSDIHIEQAHDFDLDTARAQAQKWLNEAESQFGLTVHYTQGDGVDTASISKSGVDATATLDAEKIVFRATLNFFAKPLKGAIHDGIQAGLNRYFGASHDH